MTKKAKKKFTVPEFKTWLEGIMQFQNDDWSPNREQWDEIYEKIMNLKEPVNKEKIGLNDSALDDINDIVHERNESVLNRLDQLGHLVSSRMQGASQNPNLSSMGAPVPPENQQALQQPVPAGGLENKSLSELKKEYEEQQMNVAGGHTSKHKLPDLQHAGNPDDFV